MDTQTRPDLAESVTERPGGLNLMSNMGGVGYEYGLVGSELCWLERYPFGIYFSCAISAIFKLDTPTIYFGSYFL